MVKPLQLSQAEMARMFPELSAATKQVAAIQPKRTNKPDKKNALRDAWSLIVKGDWPFVPECKFHPSRKWRFDWANAELKLAIEIDGVIRPKKGSGESVGRHQTAEGLRDDHEKTNAAIECGWRVLKFTPDMIRDDPFSVVKQIENVMLMIRMSWAD